MLSDGNIIIFGVERFQCTSVFPAIFICIKASGTIDTSSSNNMKIDVYIRKKLYANVALSSGTTMFQRIVERMLKELTRWLRPRRRSRLLLRQRESTLYRLEDRSCLLSTFSCMCGSRRTSTMDFAQPSPIGSACELTY